MHKSNDIILHCATFMPDHLHMLFTLGSTLSLAQIIRKFKSLTKPLIESKNIKWQPNYFEHRLRPDTEMEAFALYIYLNPYRKALLSNNAEWQGWILNREYRPEFINNLRDGKYPQIEWLQNELGLQDLIEDPNR